MLGPVTGTKVLLLHLVPSEAEATAKVWNPLHSLPNGGFAFADQLQHLDHFARLTLRVTNHPAERAFLAAFLGHCTRHFGHVLALVAPEAPRAALAEVAARATDTFILAQQTVDSLFEFNQLARELGMTAQGAPKRAATMRSLGRMASACSVGISRPGRPPLSPRPG